MGRIVAEVTVVPLGTASPSLSAYVAAVEKVLKDFPRLKTMLTPMSLANDVARSAPTRWWTSLTLVPTALMTMNKLEAKAWTVSATWGVWYRG